MVTYMAMPNTQVTFGSTVTSGLISATIVKKENGWDIATLVFSNDPSIYPTPASKGETVTVEVRDEAFTTTWTTLFKGTVLFADYTFGGRTEILLECAGYGYALNMMNVAEEYGANSRLYTIDTLTEIVSDATDGIIAGWVNKYLGSANDSGYAVEIHMETINGSIPFINFPYKPADKCIDDLIDIAGALNSAAYHWIVDTDNHLRIKSVASDLTGGGHIAWTKYYGASAAAATLAAGSDFIDGDFQLLGKEANVIVYNGVWCRPSGGDSYTEPASDTAARAVWTATGTGTTVYADSTDYAVGAASVKVTDTTPQAFPGNFMGLILGGNGVGIGGSPLNWDLTTFTGDPDLVLNLYIMKKTNVTGGFIRIHTNDCVTDYWEYTWTTDVAAVDKWYHFSIPIGPNYNKTDATKTWTASGTPNWNTIVAIEVIFAYTASQTASGLIDGFHLTGANITRIARQEFHDEVAAGRGNLGDTLDENITAPANPIRMRIITDTKGKDDSLSASDDSGLMAQLAKSELYKLVTEPTIGKWSTSMIPDWLPGQYAYISSTDYRVTKLTHTIGENGYRTAFEATTDVTNSHTRMRFEDINKIYASIRPEFQDRQSSSLKAGNVDIRVVPLQKAYNI